MDKAKTLFDVIGPVMIGPSSSHTAGAVRIGYLAGKIFGEKPAKLTFKLYNSFSKTGKGHGTDKGLLGGVLGYDVDNEKIKTAYQEADKLGIDYAFEYLEDYTRHPNSVDVILENDNLGKMEISGISVGAGEIAITKIDGYKFNINGDYDTIILIYKDKPGMIYRVTALLQSQNINIASMHCDRKAKGKQASMGLCIDGGISDSVIKELQNIEEVYLIRNIEVLKK